MEYGNRTYCRRIIQPSGHDLLSCAVLLVGMALTPPIARAERRVDLAELSDRANATLSLVDSVVFPIEVGNNAAAVGPMRISVPIDGVLYMLDLVPQTVRAESYELRVQLADGSYITVEPGPERTLRGSVVGLDDSAVAATVGDDGLTGTILLIDGSKYWIEPIGSRVVGAAANDHVIYRNDDAIHPGGGCELFHPPVGAQQAVDAESDGGIAGTGLLQIAELAVDADVEFFEDFDSVSAVEDRINAVINTMNVQYERDVQIRHVITTIIVRTAEPDPYNDTCVGGERNRGACSSDEDCPDGTCESVPDIILSQLRSHWRFEQQGVPRDVVQLFTGKNLSGSTIGVAWLGTPCTSTVCGSWGYSVVESNCFGCSSFATKTDLSAHELGHNWGANHCGGDDSIPPCDPDPPGCFGACSGWTMNCSITTANRFHPTLSIPDIEGFRDSRNCLDEGDELRRVLVSAEYTSVVDGDSLQFTATATFQFGPDQDVTSDAIWSADPASAGTFDSDGLFTAADVNGDVCMKASAEYTFDGLTRTGFVRVTVVDADAPLAVIVTEPPRDAIDVRQPTTLDGSAALGWQVVDVVLNGQLCQPTYSDFAVTQEGGVEEPPIVTSVLQTGDTAFRLTLSHPIEPGAWTIITHIDSGFSVRLGYLPADVNNDGTSNADDVQALLDALQAIEQPQIWSLDVDRSTRAAPGDIVRAIDLLIGADGERAWLNVSLP